MKLLIRWVISAGALYATIWLLSVVGQAQAAQAGWMPWFVAVIIMALVNSLIRPVAAFLTAPLNCLTFGILGVFLNAAMFALVPVIAENVGMPVFRLTLWGALIGSLVMPAVDGALSSLIFRSNERD